MRILVADQDIEHRRKLVNYCQNLKHTVLESLTAREVLEECKGKCPQLLFIDKELSGMSGIEIIRQIRQLGGHAIWVPIVFLGKTLSENEILQALDAGADDFLEKPAPELSERQFRYCRGGRLAAAGNRRGPSQTAHTGCLLYTSPSPRD